MTIHYLRRKMVQEYKMNHIIRQQWSLSSFSLSCVCYRTNIYADLLQSKKNSFFLDEMLRMQTELLITHRYLGTYPASFAKTMSPLWTRRIGHSLDWVFLNCLYAMSYLLPTSTRYKAEQFFSTSSLLFCLSLFSIQNARLNVLPIQYVYATWIWKYPKFSTVPPSIFRWKSKNPKHLFLLYSTDIN